MQLSERINVNNAKWLLQQPMEYFQPILNKTGGKTKDILETQFNILKSYLKNAIRMNGVTDRIYKYPDNTDPIHGNRLYSDGGIQGLQSDIRAFLMGDTTTDIDMVNAHPTILKYICNINNILCPNLTYFINYRDKIYNQFSDRNEAKRLFLASMNSGKKNAKEKNAFFKGFDKEMKQLQNELYELDVYTSIKSTIPEDKLKSNPKGSFVNRILCSYENKILNVATKLMTGRSIEIATLIFDGLLIYGNYYENTDLLEQLNTECNNVFPELNIKWTYKAHNTSLVVPDDYIELLNNQPLEPTDLEKAICYRDEQFNIFEQTHCKIINKSIYIHEYNNESHIMSSKKIIESYEHKAMVTNGKLNKDGDVGYIPFMQAWMKNNPNIKKYDTMEVIPNVIECPINVYNLWKPFAGEGLVFDIPNGFLV